MTNDVQRLVGTARSLLAKGGALQSTLGGERIEGGALKEALEQHLLEVDARLADPAGRLSPLSVKAAAAEVLSHAESALDRVAGGQSAANLSDLEVASLEAIVRVTGRPAMRFTNGRIEMPASGLGDNDRWRVLVATARAKINDAAAAVGRVALDRPGESPELIGTAWRLWADLVVTNRHVAQALVRDPAAPCPVWRIDPARRSFVDFASTDGAPAPLRFSITELVYCAPEVPVDLAVLRLDSGGAALPTALSLGGSADVGDEIYVIGHPYRRLASTASRAVFGDADGLKRCSPGLVTRLDPETNAFEHDCSTLGGNSGSCVLTVAGHTVAGLHYAGLFVNPVTGTGSANVALDLSRLGAHPAAELLRTGTI
jgi:hypothetical protein